MSDPEPDFPTPTPSSPPTGRGRSSVVDEHLRRWGEDLVELTRRNRLLYFRHLRSGSLEFDQPAAAILDGLSARANGGGWGFYLPPPPPAEGAEPLPEIGLEPAPDELIVAASLERDGVQIARGLKNLAARAQAEFLDAGIWVLYLGLGFLRWSDAGEPVASPLYLQPVRLVSRPGDKAWRLLASDDGEPALNPSLAVKLEKDHGITLPSLDDLVDDDYTTAIDAVREAIAAVPTVAERWSIDETAVLGTFTFQKDVIYRDLRRNADRIAAHPTVRLLAEGPTSDVAEALSFEPEPEDGLDDRHPPEQLACILDADATQRRCLIAARHGHSFVMDGPPGTGKSQTIANVIAQLLHDGKTVLFVSEKAAALEVVQNRLDHAGLGPFVLALHSHKATRKAVASELGAALAFEPSARSPFGADDRTRLVRERELLTAYAIAMNEIRRPLGRSVHDVIGRVTALEQGTVAQPPELDLADLDGSRLVEMLDTARALADAWGPIARGDGFLWRDLARTTDGVSRTATARAAVAAVDETTSELQRDIETIGAEFRLGVLPDLAGADALVALLDLAGRREPVGVAWLTADEAAATAMAGDAERLAAAVDERDTIAASLAAWTDRWAELDAGGGARIESTSAELDALDPPVAVADTDDAARLGARAGALDELAAAFDAVRAHGDWLGHHLGHTGPTTVDTTERLARLAGLVGSRPAPEPAWLTPDGFEAADRALTALSPLVQQHRTFSTRLSALFTPAVLDLDLAGLQARFEHNRGLKKLFGSYRDDKATLARGAVGGVVTDDHIDALPDLVEWQRVSRALDTAEAIHAAALGGHWPGRDHVDLGVVGSALDTARQALGAATGLVDPTVVVRPVAPGSPDLRAASSHAAATLSHLRRLTPAAGEATPASMSPAAGAAASPWERLAALPIVDAASWCRRAAESLRALAAELDRVQRLTPHRVGIGDGRALLTAARSHGAASAMVDGLTASTGAVLGDLAHDPAPERLRAAAAWVAEARAMFSGMIREGTAHALLSSTLDPDALRARIAHWRKAVDGLTGLFEPARADELRRDLEGSHAVATELVEGLGATIGDIDEWDRHHATRAALIGAGLGAAVEVCETRPVSADEVPGVIEHAILRRWADQTVAADDRLRPVRAVDRDRIRDEFRRLDRMLVDTAAADIVNACAARRPRSVAGGAGVIRQQAELKRRHKPVRTLLAEAGDAALRLKPCFMMSPLSVSQFLPAEMTFDVVIFDEASQVREADAICSIYRGTQLLVAGDQRQLPPTSFFDRMADGDEFDVPVGRSADDDPEPVEVHDFESVLDRCKAQGFEALPLGWHYRSRHESLIAFSNHSFYDGRLHTFPGAVFEAPDLGVELFRVDGVYRRGSTRDNEVESATVVDRIVFHRRHHPDLTIGVVALSTAQQAAVEAEIERRIDLDPELAALVTDDRLDGFFVKNLESVQGDERDIIVLTIGYGPDEAGKLTMNFGPMNKVGGERRLNVAVTRARRRIEVVASITGGQIRSETPALAHLARYLDFAERGMAALAIDIEGSQGDAESPFEEEVLRSIRAMGFDPVPQVGVAGYRIDVGVRHPTEPGSYVLGVECDGAAYHSSKVARDRDRLRQQVLEGLGWRIHRIWSTAWFADRTGEEDRLRQAITDAIAAGRPDAIAAGRPDSGSSPTPSHIVAVAASARARAAPSVTAPGAAAPATAPAAAIPATAPGAAAPATAPAAATPATAPAAAASAGAADSPEPATTDVEFVPVDFDAPPTWVVPWIEPVPDPPTGRRALEFHDPGSQATIRERIRRIVGGHGPIHAEAVLRVLRDEWGLGRAGARVRDAYDTAVDALVRTGHLARDGAILAVPAQPHVVRIPLDDGAPRRPVNEVPPAELQAAVQLLLADAGDAGYDQLRLAWARLYGWRRIGNDIEMAFEFAVDDLVAAGIVELVDPRSPGTPPVLRLITH